MRFLGRELEALLDAARAALGAFVGADPDDLAFVAERHRRRQRRAALARLRAGRRAARHRPRLQRLPERARLRGARARARAWWWRRVPVPARAPERGRGRGPGRRSTPRTRLALLDHVTSPTGLVLPIERLVASCASAAWTTLVDGAHAPGMLPLDLDALGAAYYTGNCHKWLCAPKGAAFLHVRRDRQAGVRPLVDQPRRQLAARPDRSRFRLEFDWTGTRTRPRGSPCRRRSAYLGALLPGGWPALMARNRRTALAARDACGRRSACAAPAPDDDDRLARRGAPARRLPRGPAADARPAPGGAVRATASRCRSSRWPAPPRRLLRVSAQLYNRPRTTSAWRRRSARSGRTVRSPAPEGRRGPLRSRALHGGPAIRRRGRDASRLVLHGARVLRARGGPHLHPGMALRRAGRRAGRARELPGGRHRAGPGPSPA